MTVKPRKLWGVLWRSNRRATGVPMRLVSCGNGIPALFLTRREARAWIKERYGYIPNRPDMHGCPHGWKMPIPIHITVSADITQPS